MKTVNALFALASLIENASGLDDHVAATAKEGSSFPLDPRLGFSLCLAMRTQVGTLQVAQFRLQCPPPDNNEKYYIWIDNYHLATARACRKALVFALRDIASKGDILSSRQDAMDFM